MRPKRGWKKRRYHGVQTARGSTGTKARRGTCTCTTSSLRPGRAFSHPRQTRTSRSAHPGPKENNPNSPRKWISKLAETLAKGRAGEDWGGFDREEKGGRTDGRTGTRPKRGPKRGRCMDRRDIDQLVQLVGRGSEGRKKGRK